MNDWRDTIRSHFPLFQEYVKKQGYMATGVDLAGLILWYEYIDYANQQAVKEQEQPVKPIRELVQEVSGAPDD